ncbi:sigma-54-dependent transcriptional regulator [Breznakiella homolactica]|uniref:PrpR N-terminal domain-containing protein n=1 Tax=Breznakiella homolactica TaxID=2798577 RepID=A0A7T8BAZ2_9SPIR|nr:sigma-54-dependent transcriptional regulator [Breznakiella homolactica]QQO08673.1 PrpR N-terminal domain-containing protein [Breznakiella homolactica]
MAASIRILGIAPYQGMKDVMNRLAAEYADIEFTFFVGNLEEGVEIAKRNFHANYDVIISRGGTAKMIQELLPLPVAEIGVSMYDILSAVNLTAGASGPVAMVGFSNITVHAQKLCSILNYNIDITTVEQAGEVPGILRGLQSQGYWTVLCDVIAMTTAKQLGLDAFLITSGIDSLRQTFDQAIRMCRNQQRLRDENQFLRQVIRRQIGQTIIFTTHGELFFSSLETPPEDVLDMLRKEIPETCTDRQRRILRTRGGMLYSIRAECLSSDETEYIAFFYSAKKTPLANNQAGIRFYSCQESEQSYYDSFFSVTGSVNYWQEDITRINNSTSPIMIFGESGTGKEQIVNLIYTRSAQKNRPMVSIDCALINEKSWQFLFEHHNSPLADTGSTIYFSHIDDLSGDFRRQLLAAITEMDVCRRNRVIFSCTILPQESTSKIGILFSNALGCVILKMLPLRNQLDRIPSYVKLYTNQLNLGMAEPILDIHPEALRLLREFRWDYNFTQLKRVISELVTTAAEEIISADTVRRALKKEETLATSAPYTGGEAAPLNLNRSLAEISGDIVRRVLDETNGNQTLAAKRLGISRTTLWRYSQTMT